MNAAELVSAEGVIRFGVFEVDLGARQLRKNGVRIHLQDQPFSVLVALLSRAGEPVPREELWQSIWPDTRFGDFDHGLNKAVSKLRLALADPVSTPRFIETLPKHGYRFIAPVASRSVYCSGGRLRLAVMPFRGSVADATAEKLADGLTEELITSCTKADSKRVAVVSCNSVKALALHTMQLNNSELNADYVLQGLVRSTGDRIRVSVQLIKVRLEEHVWAEIFDRLVEDVFAVQAELAKLISDTVINILAPDNGRTGLAARLSSCSALH